MCIQLLRPILKNWTLSNVPQCSSTNLNAECINIFGTSQNIETRSYSQVAQRENMCPQFKPKSKWKYKPVTHVIFDLDGTILNTEDMNFKASSAYLERVFKKKLTMDLYGLMMGSLAKDAAKLAIRELGLPITPDVYLHGVWQYLRTPLLSAKEMPGINYLSCHFERCKIPMAVATSSSSQTFNLKTRNHKKLFKKFCPIVLGGSEKNLTRGKPHPDIFLMAANRFGAPPDLPDQVLVFEDSMNGVNAAKAAGMQVIMIPSPCLPQHFIEMANPTMCLPSFQKFDPVPFGLPPYPK